MKRKAFAAMMLAAMTWAVSCEQEIKESPEESDHMVIEAVAEGIGSQTKAELAYKFDVVWNEGDQIIVMNYPTGYDTFTLTRGAGTTVGTFKQDGTLDLAGTVLALYPATLWDRERPRWPSRQSMDNLVIPTYCEMSLPRRSRTATFVGAVLQPSLAHCRYAGAKYPACMVRSAHKPY